MSRELPPIPGAYRFAAFVLKPWLNLSKLRWSGQENVPERGGCIIASNHVSSYDPLTMAHYLYNLGRPPKILAKSSMFRAPILGAVMRGTGQIPVERGTVRAADSLVHAKAALARGEVVVIFPEGTVTRDPDLWPMTARPGAAQLAMQTGYPLLPMAQWGGQALFPRGHYLPRPIPRKTMTVEVGTAIDLSDLPTTHAGYVTGTERIMDRITTMLEQIRGEQAPAVRWDMRKADGGRGPADGGAAGSQRPGGTSAGAATLDAQTGQDSAGGTGESGAAS